MNKQTKYIALWAVMYIICLIFSFIPASNDFLMVLGVALSLGFFVPPALLLHYALTTGKKQTILRVRNLCFTSLGLTLALLVLNFLSVYFSTGLGTAVYYLLILVSVPMICSQIWFLSLFCWACLMMFCLQELRKIREHEQALAQQKAEKKAEKKARRNR